MTMYALEHGDAMVPARMPDLGDGINWRVHVSRGLKYRPTFLAILGHYVGVPAFDDPVDTKNAVDQFGERGSRQNYANDVYLCPSRADWTDERNGAYGYNYQFLGNARRYGATNPAGFKNWPVRTNIIRSPARCVAAADCMGTAASFANRKPYANNSRDADRFGNEGFNLDPPRVDPLNGEMANLTSSPQSRTAADPRHLDRAAVLWTDGHGTMSTLMKLGYDTDASGVITLDGANHLFNITGADDAWIDSS